MKEQTSFQRQLDRLARDAAELRVEYRAADDEREQAIIQADIHTLEEQGTRYFERMEAARRLPEVWSAIYSGGPGFLSLFSGSRAEPNAKLERVRESYFAWPHESPAALAWIAREAAEERELYHCSHLTTRWRRRKEDAAPLTSLYVCWTSTRMASCLTEECHCVAVVAS